ncbi:MAG TPA: ABC transporter permease, partial [Candidatus Methylomirabilis sp.]|nr:ABC transporter permease [Candidatus Methylomirabilis sp.]
MRRRRDRAAVLGLGVIAAAVLVAALAPVLAPTDPLKGDLLERLSPPAWAPGGALAHPLGTDTLGRDVLSRLIHGARVSLIVGFTTVLIAGVAGVVLGVLGGYYGGRLDEAVMRIGDIQLAFPFILLAIMVLVVLGPGLANLIIVLGIGQWVTYA